MDTMLTWIEYHNKFQKEFPPETIKRMYSSYVKTETMFEIKTDPKIMNLALKPVDVWYTCPTPEKQKKDVNPMNYASVGLTNISAPSDAAQQRSYLKERLADVDLTLKEGLKDQFKMNPPQPPKTIGDLVDRLKNGAYTIEDADKTDKRIGIGYWTDYFSWRTEPADEAGYKKAKEELKAAKQKALDTIVIAEPADGLAALQEFEAFKAS